MQPIKVNLNQIISGEADKYLNDAFGPSSLGIVIIDGLDPKYQALRQKVLTFGHELANLDPSLLQKLENPESHYLVGWSRGREKLQSGKFDVNKGSFYANCNFHSNPGSLGPSIEIQERYPDLKSYTASNIWPSIPGIATEQEFRESFEELCNYIISVTELVAAACDRYYSLQGDYPANYIENIVKNSYTTKARLLNYYPEPDSSESSDSNSDSDWCGMHVDHSCLTALCSAMFFGGNQPINSGLFIESRTGELTKVSIPTNCLAFQTGSALQSITNGLIKAVPHIVKGSIKKTTTSRTTLALFCQPSLHEIVGPNDETFATFASNILKSNH